MIPKLVILESEKANARYLYNNGVLHSVFPAETLFGFTVWSHMVPPFKPEQTLILGYGGGTVAELMRKVWGPCKITGVDTERSEDRYVEYRMKIMDAKAFVWESTADGFFKNKLINTNPKYDYICIDLWNGDKVAEFIYDVEFVVRIKEMATKLVCINVLTKEVPRLRPYYDYGFNFCRTVPIEANSVIWWSV